MSWTSRDFEGRSTAKATPAPGHDLTSIFEISRKRAAEFAAVGIVSYEDLLACDPATVSADLRARGRVHLSPLKLEQMKIHARCYQEGRAILFGAPPRLGDSFVALDLEYNTFRPHIWLIGLYMVDGDRSEEHVVLWADSANREAENLEILADMLEETGDMPILTWAGTSADLPELRKGAGRLGAGDIFAGLDERHVDLFEHARRILRLPIPQLVLGDVSEFFGVSKASQVGGGLEAQMLYDSYRSTLDHEQRSSIKRELISYNCDDLRSLVETLRTIQRLPVEPQKASTGTEMLGGMPTD